MSEKVLFCATVDYHFKAFHLPYMKWFKDMGWEVHVAAKGEIKLPYADKKYNIPFERTPFSDRNLRAYKEIKEIIDTNKYGIIHCHTPMGGVLARLAARQARKKGTTVIYTAHGFHFCRGVPLLNWIVYYPIERWLARYTDCLVTINNEDYQRAVSHKFGAGCIEHVHGVGVDTEKFKPVSEEARQQLRRESGYKPDDFLMVYVAEFNKNKNQELLIRAIASIKESITQARLLLAGEGVLLDKCRELAQELGVADMVDFLGYRSDIDKIMPMCDLAVASSFREGLPVNIMEAMACGLPVVATENRGHRELVVDGENGWIVPGIDAALFAERVRALYEDSGLRACMGNESSKNVVLYSVSQVSAEISKIYRQYMQP